MTTADDLNRIVEKIDDVLITAELARRASRPPDYAAENQALTALAQEMATNPGGVLQKCAELVLELCRAESAGISLLEPGGENGRFRWRVIVGGLAGYVGSAIPREASPSGSVIAHDSVLLFREAGRFFPGVRDVEPHVCETLLAPWHLNGEAVGTLWAIKHMPDGQFDAEDARLLQSLARFAAAAHQMSDALDETKRGREALEKRVEHRTRRLSEAYESVRASEMRFRAALEIDTVGVIYLDLGGRIIDANDAFLAMGGYSREDLQAGRLTWQGLTPPEWMKASERAVAELKATGRTSPYEKEYIRKDGSRWWALFAAKRLPDGTVFEFVLDVTARKQTEAALQKSEERFQYVARATRDIIWDIDLVADRVWWSDAMLRQLGYAPEDIGRDTAWCFAHIHPEERERVVSGMREAAAGTGDSWLDEFRYQRADGSYAYIADKGFLIRDPEGMAVRMIGAMQDITERKHAEEALRASESQAKLLLAELQHRVRNTLSVIRSIVRRTVQTSKSVEDYAMHLDGRINAFARVQTAVARDPAAGLDLTQLVADELLTCVAQEGEQVRIVGPSVRLQPKAAETFGLAIHELATNAVKHGALSVPHGDIRISWRVQNGEETPQLVFEWKESGLNKVAAKRRRRGFGTDLLERTLTYELKAKTMQAFEPDGLRCTIELPLTERILIDTSASTLQQD
jgi:PAS domain S-box-containing protein